MMRVVRRIPTFWAVAFFLLVFGALGYHFYLVVAGDTKATEEKVYIPKDLDDCFVELKKILKPEDVQKMRAGTIADMIQYHHGLGTWIRNNWGLWQGSRLSRWFNERGIHHPDDMSGIILDSFWRHLNSKPVGLDEQIEIYQEYWRMICPEGSGGGVPEKSFQEIWSPDRLA